MPQVDEIAEARYHTPRKPNLRIGGANPKLNLGSSITLAT